MEARLWLSAMSLICLWYQKKEGAGAFGRWWETIFTEWASGTVESLYESMSGTPLLFD